MKREQFRSVRWLSDNKLNVETKDGREAEIVKYNENLERPFIVKIDGRYLLYSLDGMMSYEHPEDTLEFVIYEESDLTLFEKAIKSIIDCYATTKGNMFDLPYKETKKIAEELKELARKEIELEQLLEDK